MEDLTLGKPCLNPNYEENGKCPKCDAELERIEDISGVQVSYEYSSNVKEWLKVNTNYYGETVVMYKCTDCDWNDSELTKDELEEGFQEQ